MRSPSPWFAAVFVLAATAFAAESPKLRLGNQVVPKEFSVTLRAIPDQDEFLGETEIALEVKQETPVIWLNGNDLEFEKATLRRDGRGIAARVESGSEGIVGFAFAQPVPAGPADRAQRTPARERCRRHQSQRP